MNDVYVEYSFDVKPSVGKMIFRNILIIIGIFLMVYSVFFGPLLTIGIFVMVLAYFFNRTIKIEYEYILTKDEIEISRITNKSSRKKLYSIDLRYMEVFARNDRNLLHRYNCQKVQVKRFHSNRPENQVYGLMIKKSNHATCVLLNASDELIEGLKRLYPSKVEA